MAITRNNTQLTWSSSSSVSLTTGTPAAASDAFTADATCVKQSVTVTANNAAGTPSSGDTVDIYWAATTSTTNQGYPTDADNMYYLGTLDTYNNTDNDPATFQLPANPQNGKLYTVSNAASNSITITADIEETRAA